MVAKTLVNKKHVEDAVGCVPRVVLLGEGDVLLGVVIPGG